MYVCIYVCMRYIHIYIYIHTYIRTYMHIQSANFLLIVLAFLLKVPAQISTKMYPPNFIPKNKGI